MIPGTWRKAPESVVTVAYSNLKEWPISEFERRSRKLLVVTEKADVAKNPQEILAFDDHERDERRLISLLSRLSFSRKFKNRFAREDLARDLERYQKALDSGKLSKEDFLREARTAKEGVEVGAWRIQLTHGKILTALHTASSPFSMDAERAGKKRLLSFVDAVNGVLSRNQVRPGEIETIQYFHTHPGKRVSPLTNGDEKAIQELKEQLEAFNRHEIPCHIYAIFLSPNAKAFTFHMGFR